MFLDEACIAEQKRKSFQEIGVSSSHLDSSSGVSVNKWEPRNGDKFGGNRGKSPCTMGYGCESKILTLFDGNSYDTFYDRNQ